MARSLRDNLSYLGVRAPKPPNFFKYNRAPTTKDLKKFTIGEIWFEEDTENLWVLTKKKAGVATWTPFGMGGGATESFTLDDGNIVTPDAADNVNVFGGTNIGTTGAIANTVTINLNDSIHLTGDLNVDGTTTTYDLHVTHDADIDGDLNVDGTTTTQDLHVTNNAQIDVDLNVDGTTTIHDLHVTNDVNIDGDTTVDDFTATGSVDLGLGTGVVLSDAGTLSASAGTTDYVLTSNGAGALPSWQKSGNSFEPELSDFRSIGNLGSVSHIVYTGSYYVGLSSYGGLVYTDDLGRGWQKNYIAPILSGLTYGNGVIVGIHQKTVPSYGADIYVAENPYDKFDLIQGLGYITQISFVNGYFVTTGRVGSSSTYKCFFAYTTDPRTVSWTNVSYTFPYNSESYYVTYAGGYFICLGYDYTASETILIYSTTITGTFTRNYGANSANDKYIAWDGTYFGITLYNSFSSIISYSTTINGTFSSYTLPDSYNYMMYNGTYWIYGKKNSSTLIPMHYDVSAIGTFTSVCNTDTIGFQPLTVCNGKTIAIGAGSYKPQSIYTDDITGNWLNVFCKFADYTINAICFDGTNYIFVGIDSAGNAGLFYSSDINGSFLKSTTFPTTHGKDIAYKNGYYVAVSVSSTSVIYSTSINGVWITKSISLTATSTGINFIESGNGYFVAASYTGGTSTYSEISIATDPTGIWTLTSSGFNSSVRGFKFFQEEGYFIASRYTTSYAYLYKIKDPRYKWEEVDSVRIGNYDEFTVGNGLLVGLQYTSGSNGSVLFSSVYGNTRLGQSAYSSNGSIDFKFDFTPYAIAYADGVFVMSGTGIYAAGSGYAYCTDIANKPKFMASISSLSEHLETLNSKIISFGSYGKIEYTKVL